ncbi:fibrinogen-like coiled coil protein [uncultured Mediterranean phage uvDeep-CGR2-AD10-C281]|nr:fibrinogen-like coiled coil protein [uncultured Mediterranean phage uvDeep-CGR2-AD10-C281]
MNKKPLNISESAAVQMPMKTVASLIAMVAIGTWAFFGIQEKLNQHSTKLEIMEKDLVLNSEFRIGWPRGLLGSLPADSEQFMLIEELYKQTDKLQIRVDSMLHNEVNITALSKAVNKLQSDVEKLKDKQRSFANGNGH